MNLLLSFLSVFVGINLFHNIKLSLLVLVLEVFIIIKAKYKKFYIPLLFIIIGIAIFFMGKINISNEKFFGIVIESKDNYIIFKSGLSSYYVSIKDSTYEVGDILYINGKLEEYKFSFLESQFNFNDYLIEKFCYYEIKVDSINNIFLTPLKIRSFIYANLNNYSTNSQTVLGKLLFNVSLSQEYNEIISSNFLFYLLSVSSLHISILNKFNKKLLGIKLKEKTCLILVIISTVIIFLLSNYKLSIFKVLIFEVIDYLNEYKFKKKLSYIEKVSLSGLIILFFRPSYALQEGFFYCFLIPYFIYFVKDAISTKKIKYQKYYFILFINLVMIPFNIYKYGYFSIFSSLFTLVLIPFIFPLFFMGYLSLFLPLYPIVNFYSDFIFRLTKLVNILSFNIYIGRVGLVFIFIYFILLLVFIYYMEIKNKKKQVLSLGIILSFILLNKIPLKEALTSKVSFINVGQGDSCLVRYRNTSVLIDTGGLKNDDLANKSLIPYLRKERINKLDYVFITHSDYDHNGAFNSLLNNFKIGEYNQNNNFSYIKINDLEFYNLNPSVNSEDNDDSLVLYFTIKDKSFLIMGDASTNIEKKIIKTNLYQNIDYLKIGHHGSKYSTCDEFIKYTKPKEAIISCGVNNYYGHPHKEVLNILSKYKVNIRRTDIEGTISYQFYGF